MNLAAWWGGRSPRERSVLAGATAAVALLLFVALVWLPLERSRTRLEAELPALRASVAQMHAQAAQVRALRALPPRAPAATPAALVADGRVAQELPGARLALLDAKRIRLTVEDASWTRLVEWLATAQTAHGLAVDEANVEALAATGRVRAAFVLAAP